VEDGQRYRPARGAICHAARVTAEATTGGGFGRAAPRSAGVAVTAARRYAGVALLAVVLAATHIRHRPATFCLLRDLTGIPCPACGGTTAAVDLGHGDLRGALSASPFAVGLLGLGPMLSALEPPRWWQVKRNRWLVVCVILALSEIWQLVRFGIIAF
jgi:hypothetical protein